VIRLAVRCRPEIAERVLAELLELAPGGVEEDEGPDWVEYAIYGAPGELPEVGAMEAKTADERIQVTAEQVPDDWADRWRDFHKPTVIADGRVVIRPSWEPHPATSPAAPGRAAEEAAGIDVVIDPGQAFGTGAHPTTRMCVELLIGLADSGNASGPLVDLGTGSGVLAIVGARLGWSPVLAVDHEAAALEAAAANAAANETELRLERVNLRAGIAPIAETVVANLTAPLLGEVAAQLADHPDQVPRHLVCSGLLAREADDVADGFADAGLTERERRRSGDWAASRLEAG
jgi:ribosomal protein L11 methyltransferase